MKTVKLVAFFVTFCLGGQIVWAQSDLVTYAAPDGAELKKDFLVSVRQPAGVWKPLDTYAVKVDEVRDTRHHVEKASLSYFDFEGEVEVSVKYRHGRIDDACVRPFSYGIQPLIKDSLLTFMLSSPCNLSVEINGDIFHNLHLFANPIDKNNPLCTKSLRQIKRDRNLIYFGPGLHQLPNDSLNVPSGKTVYVAGGAVVKGCIYADGVRDVKILGRGKVHPEGRGAGIQIRNSKNVLVEGLISTQCPTGGSDSVTIRNVKVISSYGWGDGLNVFASNNVLWDGVFCRTSDDCTTVYATRKGFTGGCRNIRMQHSTLWADVAHPIFIGLHGNVECPDTIENIQYVDIDILDHREKQLDYQGCMAINAGDENLVRNVRFENIRIENFRQGQLLNLRICYNKKYCKAPGRGIENVWFKDIDYQGTRAELSIISGYNEQRKVKNIHFENLKINGVHISDDMSGKPKWYKTGDMARIFIGEHVEDVSFE